MTYQCATTLLQQLSLIVLLLAGMHGGYADTISKPSIAITFDDGFDVPSDGEKAKSANARILSALTEHNVRSMLFPTGTALSDPASVELVRQWGTNGHHIGSHTYHHIALSEVDTHQYIADLQRAHGQLKTLPGWCPRLRFPFLDEGKSDHQHNQVMAWLAEHDYGVAGATVLIPDWHWETHYLQLQNDPKRERVLFLLRDYVRQVVAQARVQNKYWTSKLNRSPAHVLLLHANHINAAILDELITALQADGWQIVDAYKALEDPLHQRSFSTADGNVRVLPSIPC